MYCARMAASTLEAPSGRTVRLVRGGQLIATPAQRELAGWLLTQEMGNAADAQALTAAAERVCKKLCQRLTRVVTAAGCQMLLARAVVLARTEFPFLNGVRASTTTEACLNGLQASVMDVELSTAREALTAVLASLVGLLATFIGEDLSMRLLHETWPDAPTLPRSGEREAGA
jgi:hypothetical protein